MSTEASELHRNISASVRDMVDAYRIQAQAGPVSDQTLGGDHLPGGASCRAQARTLPAAQRVALLPSVVRMLLATFLENAVGADGTKEGKAAR